MSPHILKIPLFLACLIVTSCREPEAQTPAKMEDAVGDSAPEYTGRPQPAGDKVVLRELDHGPGSAFEMFYVLSSGPLAGARHGPCYEFWGEGAVTVGQYAHGFQDGTWTCYRPDGSVRLVTEYKDGYEVGTKCLQSWDEIRKKERQRDGPWTCNFANTQVKACQGQYDKGEVVGVWTYWNPHGIIWHQSRCEKGVGLVEKRECAPWWGDVTDQEGGVALPPSVVVSPASDLRAELPAATETAEPPPAATEGVQLQGTPCWLPLGGEIYHTGTLPEAQREVLSFGDQPRWFDFPGDRIPPPKTLADLPLEPHGARLHLEVHKAEDPSVFVFRLTLSAKDRPLVREVEHRWTNTLPFLFALYSDGQAIPPSTQDQGFSKSGGMPSLMLLVPAGTQKTWSVRVDAQSLLDRLAHRAPQTVSLVAAFGERQHSPMGLLGDDGFPGVDALQNAEADGLTPEPPIVIRSNPVRIRWSGEDWIVSGEPPPAAAEGPALAEAVLPDVYCSDFLVSPNPVKRGRRVDIRYTLQCSEGAPAPANVYAVNLYIAGELVYPNAISTPLDTGSKVTYHLSHLMERTGRYTFELVVDPQDRLKESNEDNNLSRRKVEVLEGD